MKILMEGNDSLTVELKDGRTIEVVTIESHLYVGLVTPTEEEDLCKHLFVEEGFELFEPLER